MRRALFPILLLVGCAHHAPFLARTPSAPSPASSEALLHPVPTAAPAPGAATPPGATAALNPNVDVASSEDDGDDDSDEPVAEETESHEVAAAGAGTLQYTADLTDEDLAQRWKSTPQSLGCMSLGFADEGRLINAEQMPKNDAWVVVSPEKAWGTTETLGYIEAAVKKVKALHPELPPLRVNQISAREGGYLKPHKSHQSGRDVDLGFYYPTVNPIRTRERERSIDRAATWELVKAIVTETDVQLILLDRHVQKVLYDYALNAGEDKAWLDSIFHAGKHALVQHARHHRDHLHVRFYNPMAQELGRRITPYLAQRPEQNVAMHRVHSGDTLGAIARKYGATVPALQKANHLKGTFLKLAQVIRVPLRGPCTHCPVPAALEVPPRRLPPSSSTATREARADAPQPSAALRMSAAP